jgi:hypothetical protein
MLIGDFNMILRASEKNNGNLDRSSMRRFRDFVARLELKELYLHGRLFTWCNEREVPTMTMIDRALVSVDWDLLNPDALLQALSSSVSDHAPLLLTLNAGHKPKRRFRFERFWENLEGFDEALQEGWRCDERIVDPFQRLNELLRSAAAHLQSWSQKAVGNVKLKIAIANLVIHKLDAALDHRLLSLEERWLRRSLKLILLSLCSLERTIARQRSRMRWLRDGDANSKLFHSVANGRKARNFIPAVRVDNVLISDQKGKEDAFFHAYRALLGTIENREFELDLAALGLLQREPLDLDDMFSEDEVWSVVKDLPKERAPGPDGFIGSFYQRAWAWIKRDVMAAIHKLHVGDGRGFAKLNRALITLIPKKQDALDIGDFRPISLIHSFAKLFAKLLATRLSPRMDEIVSKNRSAFIRGRNLHDNFLLVRQLARKINSNREAGVLLKLDISRAFDSVSWTFLFQVLKHLGFSDKWIQWLAILFRTFEV